MKGYLTALVASAVALAAAPSAQAEYDPGCISENSIYGIRPALRTICDGPIEADGSWKRSRTFSARADYNVWYTPTFGFEGAPIPELQVGPDVYQVWPDAIPFGEPGHIAEGVVIP